MRRGLDNFDKHFVLSRETSALEASQEGLRGSSVPTKNRARERPVIQARMPILLARTTKDNVAHVIYPGRDKVKTEWITRPAPFGLTRLGRAP